ncbi:MAG: hypothetical protein ACQGVC_10700 [Myxococcota bacterium]
MQKKSLRLAALLVATVATAAFWASAAQSVVHTLGGNARYQIGNGLPIPITGAAAPNGRVLPAGAMTVMQTAAKPGPKKLTLAPGAMTAPGNFIVIPVFLANSKVFQVATAIPIQFPASMGPAAGSAVFSAGGRTGGMTETYCPGSGAVPPFACASPAAGTINGLMRYTATKNQFGGPARANAGGSADVAVKGGSPAPCTAGVGGSVNPACVAAMALATPSPTGAQGAPFGVVIGTAGSAPSPGVIFITVTAAGAITGTGGFTPMSSPGLPNPATSYGAPWTTGMLTVSVTANAGPTPEIFIMSGSDARAVNGRGALSLVSGSVSARTLTGPNANRGWLNLQIGPPVGAHVPVMPIAGLAAFGALAALTGGVALRKRNR